MQEKLIQSLETLIAQTEEACRQAKSVGSAQAEEAWETGAAKQAELDDQLEEMKQGYEELVELLKAMELEKPTLSEAQKQFSQAVSDEITVLKNALFAKEQTLKEIVLTVQTNNEMKLAFSEKIIDMLTDFHETANNEQSIMINETF